MIKHISKWTVILSCAILLSLSACARPVITKPPAVISKLGNAQCSPGILDRIYFGRNSPTGEVSDKLWKHFVETVIVPRFPAGLTEIEAQGHWQGKRKVIEVEQSRIVEVTHEDSPLAASSIAEIAEEYRKRFSQEAVLVVRSKVEACI